MRNTFALACAVLLTAGWLTESTVHASAPGDWLSVARRAQLVIDGTVLKAQLVKDPAKEARARAEATEGELASNVWGVTPLRPDDYIVGQLYTVRVNDCLKPRFGCRRLSEVQVFTPWSRVRDISIPRRLQVNARYEMFLVLLASPYRDPQIPSGGVDGLVAYPADGESGSEQQLDPTKLVFGLLAEPAALTRIDLESAAGAALERLRTDAPTVQLVSPQPNQTVSGWLDMETVATPSESLASVRYWIDGAPTSRPLIAAPYRFRLPATMLPSGSHVLEVRAEDALGRALSPLSVAFTIERRPESTLVVDLTLDSTRTADGVNLARVAASVASLDGRAISDVKLIGLLPPDLPTGDVRGASRGADSRTWEVLATPGTTYNAVYTAYDPYKNLLVGSGSVTIPQQ